ncbi:ribosome recycling factor [Flammeovirga yaeyamensis]|uniref:Ribosome-recycling factor n=1 Tax=Flammeovirga yaeyamensis TaxID=367791 RepID=A0AAX1N6P2_9BACT|nr:MULTISPECIES: ribosome recycling factor [Flammeovirga]ANQ49686.1 ribosome recycling factor [Flammeovirga sp. MY04]MBB3697455.1 ribosome recycling factor [Flammeovirga yaeyamensis]NMF36149.1 ribosome recycling factor [Flammeovirga yaeyamensis]QWG02882.1 ribosome recycling factor [Flammeovirga yaeyamensis]
MEEEIGMYLDDAKEMMEKAISHTEHELSKIRAGKASASMLDGLTVDYYGAPTPINQVASATTPDAYSVVIKPWEKNMLSEIEKSIRDSDLGVNPVNDGEQVRINMPPLTEERRRELVKRVKGEIEKGKISIRNARKDTNDGLKKLLKDGASEDAIKDAEASVQDLTNAFTKKIEEVFVKKEKDIMTV